MSAEVLDEFPEDGAEGVDRGEWKLLSVLFSSQPLTSAIGMRLARSAFDLYSRDEGRLKLKGALLEGEVRNLQKVVLLGSLPGHAFEADLETERGHLSVRYLLTDDGLAALARARPRHLLN